MMSMSASLHPATEEKQRQQALSERPGPTRSLSASTLRDRLSKLAATPLVNVHVPNPVAALQSNVDFVPAQIPRKRRVQMLVVAIWSTMIVTTTSVWLILCSFPPLWPLLALYYMWSHFIDKAPTHGGRSSHLFRSSRFWRYFADYYPASFLKEADLPADRPYVFGYHPHGIIGMGALATFATEATGFSNAFPGIKPHLLTLASNFTMPFYRDILLALGVCSVSKESCSNILKSGPGSSITIVVGGAAESLSAHPGTADLTLRKRLGFIKVAIQHGADLVPVFSFGENDIYQQMPNEKGTTVYALQRKFQSIFGFTLPLFHGRGLLNYNIGLMPYRRRIVAVIGRPIHVEQCDKPTLEELTRVQKKYIEELTRIWNAYKDTFAKARLRELMIID
ncbi:diacylglycerol acyltransferase-domain-containing protein [Crepidotus variabilis]|uniref:Diacylglycerol O-acyltransferase n=1 Tax=Crepidotus variabilis TaxID=179855 RepID=A0A9P6EH28_9AGAR|nr:diacylglycerol acyltransferase-domain-containing protein [Crepidotus variabilis]